MQTVNKTKYILYSVYTLYSLFVCLMFIIVFTSSGCSNDDLDKDGNPKVFKIAFSVSSEDKPEEAYRRMEPIRLYLEKELGTPVKFIQVNTYAPAIEALKAKKIHMSILSPYPYLLARDKAHVTSLFYMGKNNGEQTGEYKTAIVTRKESGLKTIEDIKAKSHELTLVFVDPASTSGHIIPEHYFRQQGVNTNKDFKKVVFANSAMSAILTLYSGKVDIACAQTSSFRSVYSLNTNITKDDFNFIWISEPLPPTAYCIRNDINPKFKKKVLDAYMNIKKDTAAWNTVKLNRKIAKYSSTLPLDSMRYIPSDEKMYDAFAKIVNDMKGMEIK